jgi:aminoglycoside phosphotransferase (APT) family kinase protein
VSEPLQPGASLHGRRGTYEVVRPLGRGGFADTYLARRAAEPRDVVLKVLRLDRAERWKTVELFEREARVLERLHHPSIPEHVDDFPLETADAPVGFALVQSFVPGPTLREVLRRGERLPEAAMRAWLTTLLEVCAYLHSQSPPVIHRDIHPGNVILRESDGLAVLIDFGIVQAALRSASTVSSTAAGTFGYAPLEQFVGRATSASDLYSVAATYLAVASGLEPDRMPFARNRIQVAETLRGVAVDAGLVLLLEEMTEPDAARRPQSATEVLERLRALGALARPHPAPAAPAPTARGEVRERVAAVERRWREAAARAGSVADGWEIPAYPEPGDITGFAVAPDGRNAWLAFGHDEGVAALLDTDRLRLSTPLGAPAHGIGASLTLSADGLGVIASDLDGARAFVLAPDGRPREVRLEVEGDAAFWMKRDQLAVAVSADRRRLAFLLTFSDAAGAYLVDLETGKVLQRLPVPEDQSSVLGYGALLFAPDQRALAAVPRHGPALVMDVRGRWHALDAAVLAFSPDGRSLALGEDGGKTLRVGEIEGLLPLRWRGSPRTLWRGDADIELVRFSPDGGRLAFACDDKRLLVLDVAGGALLLDAEDPHRPGRRWKDIEALGFSADGGRLFVHGDCARTPTDAERSAAVAVYALAPGHALGTLVRESDRGAGLAGISTTGFYGAVPGTRRQSHTPLHRPDVVTALFRGERWEQQLAEKERARAADLEMRISFWTSMAARGRIAEGGAIGELVNASRGLAHLLPRAVELASRGDSDRPRLGEAGGEETPLPVSGVLAALQELAGRSPAEREAIFEDVLGRLLADETRRAGAEEQGRRAEARRAWWAAKGRRIVLGGALLALLGLIAWLVLGR